MAVTAAAALVAVGLSAYKAVKSAKEKKKAEQDAARLRQPMYQVQDEYIQNQNLATANATQGYTGAAKDFLTTEAQRGLSAASGAISQTGGGANDYSKLFSTYMRSIDQTAANDSQLQLGNIQRLMDQNKEIASQKTIGWSLNEDRPYQTKRKEFRQEQQIADANMWDGIQSGVGSLGAFATSMDSIIAQKKNQNPNNSMSGNYFNQEVPLINVTPRGNSGIQQRQTPYINQQSLNPNNSMSDGGGYYPGSTDNNWSNALGLDYQ